MMEGLGVLQLSDGDRCSGAYVARNLLGSLFSKRSLDLVRCLVRVANASRVSVPRHKHSLGLRVEDLGTCLRLRWALAEMRSWLSGLSRTSANTSSAVPAEEQGQDINPKPLDPETLSPEPQRAHNPLLELHTVGFCLPNLLRLCETNTAGQAA